MVFVELGRSRYHWNPAPQPLGHAASLLIYFNSHIKNCSIVITASLTRAVDHDKPEFLYADPLSGYYSAPLTRSSAFAKRPRDL